MILEMKHRPQKPRKAKESAEGDMFAQISPKGGIRHSFTWWRNGMITYHHESWPDTDFVVIAEGRFDYAYCNLVSVMQHYMDSDCGHYRDYRANRMKHLLDPAIITERRMAAKKYSHLAERINKRVQVNG